MIGLRTSLSPHLLRLGRAIHKRTLGYSDRQFEGELCPACGRSSEVAMHGVLWPELVLQWGLSPAWANWMDQREGLRCLSCRSNLRCRHLAKCVVTAMNARLGTQAECLQQLCLDPRMQNLQVAEINAAGDLHPFFKPLSNLHYSEYGSTDPAIPSEDLLSLSYPDGSFDLVITSDVLEHVAHFEEALAEIHRILRPGGLHIFSVPIDWTQEHSRRRAELRDGKVEHLLPPSHHGAVQQGKDDFLVFHEFGRDFVRKCEEVGFAVCLTEDVRNPSVVTFTASRRN